MRLFSHLLLPGFALNHDEHENKLKEIETVEEKTRKQTAFAIRPGQFGEIFVRIPWKLACMNACMHVGCVPSHRSAPLLDRESVLSK